MPSSRMMKIVKLDLVNRSKKTTKIIYLNSKNLKLDQKHHFSWCFLTVEDSSLCRVNLNTTSNVADVFLEKIIPQGQREQLAGTAKGKSRTELVSS